jgi:hypothetical protein
MREVYLNENISLPIVLQSLDFIRSPTPTFEEDKLGILSELKALFNYTGPSTTGPALPDSLIPLEKGDMPAPIVEDFMDLEAIESSGSGSGSDSGSEDSDIDMPEVKPQGNVGSSSDSSSEESESGENTEEGEDVGGESGEESDDE